MNVQLQTDQEKIVLIFKVLYIMQQIFNLRLTSYLATIHHEMKQK